jgi:hypothetical protein
MNNRRVSEGSINHTIPTVHKTHSKFLQGILTTFLQDIIQVKESGIKPEFMYPTLAVLLS